ncbi:hypothetical protein EDD15DRAFT_2377762 [Pisolithus albus]|nr:hypothetical protein EDD15DRAFT_2377762 [Pisolithus albus]
MDGLPLQDANPSSNQGKSPCPLQPIPRFYFPPTPGARPDSPYPLGDNSATATVPVTPNINGLAWQFSDDTVRHMSFTDLLQDSIDVYGGHTELDSVRLPPPTASSTIFPNQSLTDPGGAATVLGEQLAVPVARDASTFTQDRLPGLSTAARDPLPVLNTEATEGTRDAPAPDSCLPTLSTGAGDPPQALNDASWKSRNPGRPVIPPRSSEKLDAAQRAARKAAAELRRVKQQAVTNAVAELLEEQETRINEIAKAHSVLTFPSGPGLKRLWAICVRAYLTIPIPF